MKLTTKQSLPVTGVPERPLRERTEELGIALLARGLSMVGALAFGRNLSSIRNQSVVLGDLKPDGELVLNDLERLRRAGEIMGHLADASLHAPSEANTVMEAATTSGLRQPTTVTEPAARLAA